MNQADLELLIANCASEPIHIPGSVQPHGALLAFAGPGLTLVQVSENIVDHIGITAEQALGHPLEKILPQADVNAIRSVLQSDTLPVFTTFDFRRGAKQVSYDGVVHRSGELAVLEIERRKDGTPTDLIALHHRVKLLTNRLHETQSLNEAYRIVTDEVKHLTGFDRVLIYRFDDSWNGEVVGEAKEPEQDSFLNLRYPESDIPPQARRFYERNWVRLIPNAAYAPASLVPEINPHTNQPLDLSLAILRSVSPVHVQYLKNMQVGASMSISIMKDRMLWGLIACTHHKAHFVPYELRSACEFIGQALSVKLVKLESSERYEERLKVNGVLQLLRRQASETGLKRGLTELSPNLLDLVPAGGAALAFGSDIIRLGITPPDQSILSICAWLRQNAVETVYATDSLPERFPPAAALRECASGILAISLGGGPGNYIIWFRPEVITTLKWAGNPYEPANFDVSSKALSPRRSFEQWQEQVKLRSEGWTGWQIDGAAELRRGLIDTLQRVQMERSHAALELERSELQSLNAAKDEFLAIVSHELRSPLNVIVGYAELLRDEIAGNEYFEQAIDAIMRNAKTQARLISDLLDASRIVTGKLSLDPSVVQVKELITDVRDAVRFAAESKKIKLEIIADETLTHFTGDTARLKQVLWNLLSNAIKFTPSKGRVTLEVRRSDSAIEFRVIDTGQGIDPEFLPFLFDRFKQESATTTRRHGGLGLGLSIVKSIAELHGGSVYAESEGKGHGSTFSVTLPFQAVVSDLSSSNPNVFLEQPSDQLSSLDKLEILVIDDDTDARQLVSMVLSRAGAYVRTAVNVNQGLEMAFERRPDVIVCDINLGTEDGYLFVQRLRNQEREVGRQPTPVLALTASTGTEMRQGVLNTGFQAILLKPVLGSELTRVIGELGRR